MRSELFWREIDTRVRVAARLIAIRSDVLASTDYEDLAQSTMIDLKAFVDRRRAEQPDLSIEELREETLAFGKKALQNNFLDLVRKNRRRLVKLARLTANSTENEGYLDVGRQRAATPEEQAIVIDWIEKMRAQSKSPRMHRILDACAAIARSEAAVTPKHLSELSDVSDLHKFRGFVRGFGRLVDKGRK